MATASSRATSTSLKLELDNGALFALAISIRTTPTPSADNLGLPEEPESSTAAQLVVVLVATRLVLCLLPSESSLDLMLWIVARTAPPMVHVSRIALISLLVLLVLRWFAPPTESLVWCAWPSILFHLK